MIKPYISAILALGVLAPSAQLIAAEKVLILDFTMDTVEICDRQENCKDVPRAELPKDTGLPLEVKSYDKPTGMLMYKLEEVEYWVHQSEVSLNQKASASYICTSHTIARKSDEETFGSLGLGEGCDQ